MADIRASVCYRDSTDPHGFPTAEDYDEAISLLQDARSQLRPNADHCHVCGDSGDWSGVCHHNPLVLARKWAQARSVWQCYHCGFVATNETEAELHFGRTEDEAAMCVIERARMREHGELPPIEANPSPRTDMINRLNMMIEDPMWPNHVEASKGLLRNLVRLLGGKAPYAQGGFVAIPREVEAFCGSPSPAIAPPCPESELPDPMTQAGVLVINRYDDKNSMRWLGFGDPELK